MGDINAKYGLYLKLLDEKSRRDGVTYSTAEVCRQTGIPENVIANWKKRGGLLNAKNLSALSDFLGVQISIFINEK